MIGPSSGFGPGLNNIYGAGGPLHSLVPPGMGLFGSQNTANLSMALSLFPVPNFLATPVSAAAGTVVVGPSKCPLSLNDLSLKGIWKYTDHSAQLLLPTTVQHRTSFSRRNREPDCVTKVYTIGDWRIIIVLLQLLDRIQDSIYKPFSTKPNAITYAASVSTKYATDVYAWRNRPLYIHIM